jgi:hypothetical protein
VIDREISRKIRKRSLSVSEIVESLLAMWALGGERAEDLDQFRQDKARTLPLDRLGRIRSHSPLSIVSARRRTLSSAGLFRS